MAYIMGNRKQKTFFPPMIEDYVGREGPVRVYDAIIESIDLQEMGIPIDPFQSGAHTFYPKAMLKLIVYGYSYGIRCSRRLVLMKMGIRKGVSSQSVLSTILCKFFFSDLFKEG